MKIPKKLKTIPILEAIFEIRFETNSPAETNTGIIYNSFKSEFENVENFPIINIPAEIRNSDEKLKYQPYQKMVSKDKSYILQYGQRQISLHCVDYKYDVFENFKSNIVLVLEKLETLDIISNIKRVGLRYTDFLNDKIVPGYTFEALNVSIDIAGMDRGNNFSCSTYFDGKRAKHKTQIYNSIQIDYKNEKMNGDLIDLDSFIEPANISLSEIESTISSVHDEQKEIFFGILGETVTNLLGPDYE